MAPVVVMLMENTIQTKSGDWSKMFATFDLKGSTHGRQVGKRDKNGVKKRIQPSTVQKDLDFLEAKERNHKLFIMDELNRKLQNVLLQDTSFLIRHGFLDYSLLLAVEKTGEKV